MHTNHRVLDVGRPHAGVAAGEQLVLAADGGDPMRQHAPDVADVARVGPAPRLGKVG